MILEPGILCCFFFCGYLEEGLSTMSFSNYQIIDDNFFQKFTRSGVFYIFVSSDMLFIIDLGAAALIYCLISSTGDNTTVNESS